MLGKLIFLKVKRKTPACMMFPGTNKMPHAQRAISSYVTVQLNLHFLCIQIASCPCDEMQSLHNVFCSVLFLRIKKKLGPSQTRRPTNL